MKNEQLVVEQMLLSNRLHVLCLAETWLDPNFNLSLIDIENYYFIGNNRDLMSSNHSKIVQGGGVGCYIHNQLSSKILAKSENTVLNQTEFLIIEVSTNNIHSKPRMLLAVVYRRPKGALLTDFFLSLSKFEQSYKNIVIAGDFNINYTDSSFESDHLKSLIIEHSFYHVPLGPTHFTSKSSSTIDYILTDSQNKVDSQSLSNIPIAAGHHALNIKYKFDFTNSIKTIRYRDWKRCNLAIANSLFE